MAALYTQRLFAGTNPSGANVISATVPTGFIWVVRHISLLTPGAPFSNDGGWGFFDNNVFPIFGRANGLSQGVKWYQWDGRAVLVAGQWIIFSPSKAGYSWIVTGYALTTP